MKEEVKVLDQEQEYILRLITNDFMELCQPQPVLLEQSALDGGIAIAMCHLIILFLLGNLKLRLVQDFIPTVSISGAGFSNDHDRVSALCQE